MIVGIGTDVAEIARIGRAIDSHGERFVARVFTASEAQYCQQTPHAAAQRFAVRFAAKEAGAKALGTGIAEGVRWRDIEVTHLSDGRPTLILHGHAAELAARLGVRSVHLSLSHGHEIATAMVILEA